MGVPIRTHRDLIVWQQSYALGKTIHVLSKGFPTDERFGLTSQMRRSATSVPCNIAEGFGRGTTDAYLHHLRIARGSLFELDTQIQYAADFGYLPSDRHPALREDWSEVDRLLQALIRSLGG